jgi:hypothetical protein
MNKEGCEIYYPMDTASMFHILQYATKLKFRTLNEYHTLYRPKMLLSAMINSLIFSISLGGPEIVDVPVSIIVSHPF